MPVVYYYIFLRFGVILRLGKVTAAMPVVDIAIQRVGIGAAISLIWVIYSNFLVNKTTPYGHSIAVPLRQMWFKYMKTAVISSDMQKKRWVIPT